MKASTSTNIATPLAAPTGSRRERPILFSGPMVQAILAGWKTQTRRMVKPQPSSEIDNLGDGESIIDLQSDRLIRCPYGAPGDRLWVRETWYSSTPRIRSRVRYRADDAIRLEDGSFAAAVCNKPRWKPSIHMPRWASRITLEIVEVRVEKLKDISEDDARHEGAPPMEDIGNVYAFTRSGAPFPGSSHRDGFKWLWETINGPGSWDLNPWVWVVEFKTSNTEVGDPSSGSRH